MNIVCIFFRHRYLIDFPFCSFLLATLWLDVPRLFDPCLYSLTSPKFVFLLCGRKWRHCLTSEAFPVNKKFNETIATSNAHCVTTRLWYSFCFFFIDYDCSVSLWGFPRISKILVRAAHTALLFWKNKSTLVSRKKNWICACVPACVIFLEDAIKLKGEFLWFESSFHHPTFFLPSNFFRCVLASL